MSQSCPAYLKPGLMFKLGYLLVRPFSDLMYVTYGRSDEQQVQHVCAHAPAPSLHYFRHTAFVVSLLYRISILKLRLNAADPGDMKAPCPRLLPVRGIKTSGVQD